jgi:hypothetical protein
MEHRSIQDIDRRTNRRYDLRLPVHYRISLKGTPPRAGTGITRDMSTTGLSFQCRKPLPVGAHIEMLIGWPAKAAGEQSIDLQITGFVLRSDAARTAVRVTSSRFRTDNVAAQRYPVSA